MMQHAKIRALLLLILLSILLVACRGDDKPKSTNQPPNPAPAEPTPTLPFSVNLTLWHSFEGDLANGLQALADHFATSEGAVSLSLEYHAPAELRADFEQAVRAGGGPDLLVIEPSWLAELADEGLIFPVDRSLLPQFEDLFPPAFYGSLSYRQQLWAAPLTADVLVLYTNRELVEQPPATFDELLTSTQPIIMPTGVEATIGLYIGSTDFLVNEDGQPTLLRDAVIEYLKRIQQLGASPSLTFTDDISAFSSGQAGILIANASRYAELQTALGDSLQVSLLPQIDVTNWRPIVNVTPIVISQNATDTTIRAAQLLFTYLMSSDVQSAFAQAAHRAPLAVADPTSLDAVNQVIALQYRFAQPWSPYPILTTRVFPALEQAATNALTENANLPSIADEVLAGLQSP